MAQHDEIDLEGEGRTERELARARGRRRTRRPWPWVVGALALVVGGSLAAPPGGSGLVTGPVVELGLLDLDLAAPPTTAWSLDLDDGGGYVPRVLDVMGGTVVVEDQDRMAGHDVVTGEPVWTLDLPAGSCRANVLTLTCVVRSGSPDAVVRRVDPADGTTVDIPVPRALLALDVEVEVDGDGDGDGGGGDVVVVTAGDRADHVLSRVGTDGTVMWDRPVELGLVAGDLSASYAVQLVGGTVYVAAGEPVFLDLGTGEEVPREVVPVPLGDGASATPSGTSGTADEVPLYDLAVDGEVVATDEPVFVAFDDALGGPVRLTLEPGPQGRVTAAARRGGAVLWTAELDGDAAARVDGTVVLSAYSGQVETLHGLDELTGEEHWRADDRRVLGASGSLLLVGTPSDVAVEARDPVTGAVLWTVDLPQPARFATEVPGGVLVRTAAPGGVSSGLVMLAWPG